MSIERRLQLGIIIPGGLAVLVIGLVLTWTARQESIASHQNRTINEVVRGIFELNIVTNDYLLHPEDDRARAQWQARYDSLGQLLTDVEAATQEEQLILARINESYAEIRTFFLQLVTASSKADPAGEEALPQTDKQQRLVSQLSVRAQTTVADAFRLEEITAANLEMTQQRGNVLLLIFGGIAALLALSLIVWTSRKFVAEIRKLQQGTAIIASGNLEYEVETDSQDEIGDLSRAFNNMTRKLRKAQEVLKGEIEERNRAEESLQEYAIQLERSNRELQDFAYIASHDLQEPLRKIQAFGDRLQAKSYQALGDEGRDYLARMQNAAGRMQTMINDLLSLSRVNSQGQPYAPTDLSKVAQEVVSDLEALIEQTGGRVEVGELPTVASDPTQMRQLLQNLIGNALKFHKEGKTPLVKIYSRHVNGLGRGTDPVRQPEEICELIVEDNGIGFDEKYLDRIFQPFQRLHGRGIYAGTGMGLAICRKIVERHGTTITAHSKPGSGATFVVSLPVTRPDVKQENGA